MEYILRIIKDITKNTDQWIKEKEGIRYSQKYIDIKKNVIRLYSQKEINFEQDIDMIFDIYIKCGVKYIPFELLMLLAVEINNDERYKQVLSLAEIDKVNNLILESIKDKINFNIKPLHLRKKLKLLLISNSSDNLRMFIVRKLGILKQVKIDDIDSQEIVMKVKGFKKYEVVNYYSEFDNYYFVPSYEVSFINKDTGNIIKSLEGEKNHVGSKIAMDYIAVYGNALNIKKQADRILLSKLYYEIYNCIYRVNEKIIKEIFRNREFIEEESIKKLETKLLVGNISRHIERLEKNPSDEEVVSIINELDSCEKIFETLKMSNSILKRELDINTYITAIVKCSELDNKSVSLSVLYEELLMNKPVVIDAIAKFLFDLYELKLYTKNTLKTIKYLSSTISDNAVIDETFIRININNNILNRQVLDKFVKLKSLKKEGLDDVTYKIIHSYKLEYNKEIISIFKEFYDKYGDEKCLEIIVISLIRNNISLKEYNITAVEIEKLLKSYMKIGLDISEKVLMPIVEEFYEEQRVRDVAINIIEENYSKNDLKYIEYINKNYSHLIKTLFSKSSQVFLRYIEYISKKSTEYFIEKEDLISIFSNLLCDEKFEMEKRLSIFLKLASYYSKTKNISKFIEVINYYMVNLSVLDEYQSFKKILILEVKNLEFIAESLYTTKIIEIENAKPILNFLATHFLENNMFEAIETIFKYYVEKESYGIENILILNKYLEKVETVNIVIYNAYITQFLLNIKGERQKELYVKLCSREDFPIEIREEFYYLDQSDKNLDFLINAFENEEITSVSIKVKALEKHYDNNLKFAEILSLGEYSNELIEILEKKIKEEFKKDKDYIYNDILQEEILNLDSRFVEINKYVENYLFNIFNLESRSVFEDFKVEKREKYAIVDNIKLEGIFTSEVVKCTYFKNESLRKCIVKYMNENEVQYYKIEGVLYIIEGYEEDLEYTEENFAKAIANIRRFAELCKILYKNNLIISKYNFEDFLITSKGIILKDFKECNERNNRAAEHIIINQLVKFIMEILNKYVISEESKVNRLIRKLKVDKIKSFNELELMLEESILEVSKLPLSDQVENIREMDNCEKLLVVNNIIEKNDYTIESKRIVINYDINTVICIENYIDYLIQCFIFYQKDLRKSELKLIYDKIIILLEQVDEEFITDNEFNIENILFQAKNITGYNMKKIKKDYLKLEILVDEQEYILSRI